MFPNVLFHPAQLSYSVKYIVFDARCGLQDHGARPPCMTATLSVAAAAHTKYDVMAQCHVAVLVSLAMPEIHQTLWPWPWKCWDAMCT